jgi:hypothetical protein
MSILRRRSVSSTANGFSLSSRGFFSVGTSSIFDLVKKQLNTCDHPLEIYVINITSS